MNKKCGIYCIENLINNKKYIGQSKNINHRKSEHFSRLRNNKHSNSYLQKSWNKYGEENFKFYILAECEIYELDELEKYYISFFNTMNKNYGYNRESGGNRKKFLSEETKLKISQSHIDVSGANNPFYNKKHSKESIEKYKDNINYINRKHKGEESHMSKLTSEQVVFIKKYLKENKISYTEEKQLAKDLNVSIGAIQNIKHNRTWKHILV